MNRVLNAARIQHDRSTLVVLPALLAATVAIGLVVSSLTGRTGGTSEVSIVGALGLMIVVLPVPAVHWTRVTRFVPYLVGLGVTRRTAYAAALLLAAAESIYLGLVLALGSALQRATGQWGVDLVVLLPGDGLVVDWSGWTMFLFWLAMGGVVGGAVFTRWGRLGGWVAGVTVIALLAGCGTLITDPGRAPALADLLHVLVTGSVSYLSYLTLLVLMIGGGWLAVRRATV